MLNEGHINPQIVAALARLGFKISTRSLQRFLKSSVREGEGPSLSYLVTLLWYPRMEKMGSESYSGYVWAEESLLPGGASPVIISNGDDHLVSVSELFARAGPAPTTATATAIPAAGTHKQGLYLKMSV
jgi:hypothetical protein